MAAHKTPVVKRWLTTHPRFVLHFTPTSTSWLNPVERWFSGQTPKKLRRATHTSVHQLDTWNDNPRPYVWTKTADQILESIGNYCTRINDSEHRASAFSPLLRDRGRHEKCQQRAGRTPRNCRILTLMLVIAFAAAALTAALTRDIARLAERYRSHKVLTEAS